MRNVLKKVCITTALSWPLLVGCSSSSAPEDNPDRYLGLAPATTFGTIPEGSPLQPFKRLFSNLKSADIEANLDAVYANPLYFNDTFHAFSDRNALKRYLIGLADVAETQVTLLDAVQSGNDFLVRWTMRTQSQVGWKMLDIESVGMTHLRFNDQGKIVLHQDFWDAAGGFYEHLPLLGSSIKAIRSRFKE